MFTALCFIHAQVPSGMAALIRTGSSLAHPFPHYAEAEIAEMGVA